MSPREVIAKAISNAYETRHLKTDIWLEMADAVIDALEGMDVTEAMRGAYSNIDGLVLDDDAWRAMVGAMRDE